MSDRRRPLWALISFLVCLAVLEGAARVVWWHRARVAFDVTRQHAQELLRNDLINYMKEPDGLYSYVLKRNFHQGGMVVNGQGFAQREEVVLEHPRGQLRLMAVGESTTQGNDVDAGNYPAYLRRLLAAPGAGCDRAEVINAGVVGWYSDQAALRAEHELAAYQPDIVLLFVGWIDFVAYDPYGGPPPASAFELHLHGSRFHEQAAAISKSVALLSALAKRYAALDVARVLPVAPRDSRPEDLYRYYLRSLDRIVTAFRASNSQVQVCLCTLVGRWPQLSPQEYASDSGRLWWMKNHDVSCAEAAWRLQRFNDLIRRYAAEHQLLLIDTAAAFERLDRHRLQWDFCHLHHEGYELLAEEMYEDLRQAGLIRGELRSRREELLAKYRLP